MQVMTSPFQPNLTAPMPWFGGKRRVADIVWERFGDIHNYVEPFAGSLAVLLGRPHAGRVETVNDIDRYLANAWRAIQWAPEAVAYYADWPVNEGDLHARHLWLVQEGAARLEQIERDPEFFDPQVAGWWLWGINLWIGSGWCERPDWTGRVNAGRAARGIHAKRPKLGRGASGDLARMAEGVRKMKHQRPHLSDARGVISQQLPALHGNRKHGRGDLYEYMGALAERLRTVRVCVGDWQRVITPSVTYKIGTTGIFFDPPYAAEAGRDMSLYNHDSGDIAHAVREWCLGEMVDRRGSAVLYEGPRYLHPKLRIALCGYEDEHGPHMPSSWECVEWKANGGYGNQREVPNDNARKERIWFSPNCLKPMENPRMMRLI